MLRTESVLTNAILGSISDAVIIVTSEKTVAYLNSAAALLTGWTQQDAIHQDIDEVAIARDLLTGEIISLHQILDSLSGVESHQLEFSLDHRSGTPVAVQGILLSVFYSDAGATVQLLVINSSPKSSKNSPSYPRLVAYDPVTDLINRHEFDRRLMTVVSDMNYMERESVLCYMDLDQFKVINNNCGHFAGDELLRQISTILRQQVRAGDVLARLGSDEFGLILLNCSIFHASSTVQKILDIIAEYRFSWDERRFSIGLSFGVVSIQRSTESADVLLRNAESACYMARESGGNRYHIHCENDNALIERQTEMQWVDRINWALDNDQFAIYVQRIELTGTKESVSTHFEVLVRMISKLEEIIPPGLFLPSAEKFNLASKIDRWVVSSTLNWLSENLNTLTDLKSCSINLSGQSLGDEQFIPFLIGELDRTSVPMHCICFEITETTTIANLANARKLINSVKQKGCLFALDDFGSGLSSFAYLRTLPVDYLKIDGLFVKEMLKNKIDLAIVRSIVEIGQSMNVKTIAEFVETDEIRTKLNELRVDFVQGYGVAKPQPIEELMTERGQLSITH